MSGLSSACPLPLLAQFATWTWRMSGALRRMSFIHIKNDRCQSLWILCRVRFSYVQESKVADRAKKSK